MVMAEDIIEEAMAERERLKINKNFCIALKTLHDVRSCQEYGSIKGNLSGTVIMFSGLENTVTV